MRFTITPVVEIGRSSFPTASMLPDSRADAVAAHHSWLKPHFFDEAVGDLASRIQTYLVKTPEHTILIDTCVGNDKRREGSALWHMRAGGYLDDLAAAGVTPEQVDFVVCTHLHVDHVGWNTRFVDGRWVPTFPTAPATSSSARSGSTGATRRTSASPTASCPWSSTGRSTSSRATMPSAAGSASSPRPATPRATSRVRLETSAGRAVFSGDLMHRVVQVAEPQWSSIFCADPARAAATRRDFVERYADSGVLVLAAHFPRPGYIVREGGGTRFTPAA